ncbi:MAG: hypothetical protein AAF322_10570, partial [Pseudomonadota bacterium]
MIRSSAAAARALRAALAALALAALTAFALVAAAPDAALAQAFLLGEAETDAPPPDLSSAEAIREMVSRMSDAEVRALLLDRLDAVAAEAAADAEEGGGLVDFARRAVIGPYESVVDAVGRAPLIWSDQKKSFSVFYERLGASGVAFMTLTLALAVAAGLAVEQIFRRLVRGWIERESGVDGARSLGQTILFLIKRLTT